MSSACADLKDPGHKILQAAQDSSPDKRRPPTVQTTGTARSWPFPTPLGSVEIHRTMAIMWEKCVVDHSFSFMLCTSIKHQLLNRWRWNLVWKEVTRFNQTYTFPYSEDSKGLRLMKLIRKFGKYATPEPNIYVPPRSFWAHPWHLKLCLPSWISCRTYGAEVWYNE